MKYLILSLFAIVYSCKKYFSSGKNSNNESKIPINLMVSLNEYFPKDISRIILDYATGTKRIGKGRMKKRKNKKKKINLILDLLREHLVEPLNEYFPGEIISIIINQIT